MNTTDATNNVGILDDSLKPTSEPFQECQQMADPMKWSCISDNAKRWNVNPEDLTLRHPNSWELCCAVWDVYNCMLKFIKLNCNETKNEGFKEYLKFLDNVRNDYEQKGCQPFPYTSDSNGTDVCSDGIALKSNHNVFNCLLFIFIFYYFINILLI